MPLYPSKRCLSLDMIEFIPLTDCLLLDQGVFGVPLTILSQREQGKREAPIKPPRIFCEVSNKRC